jgi:hypothetical protein
MILGLRLLEHPNGRATLQMEVGKVAGVDEDGVAHLTGQSEWLDVPMFGPHEWGYDANGDIILQNADKARSNVIG